MAKRKFTDEVIQAASAPAEGIHRLQQKFDGEIAAALAEKFGVSNPMARPRLEKIVLNVNVGRHLENNKLPGTIRETVLDTLHRVSGQKPVTLKARKSVSNFKVREGADTAFMVTLRRRRMWDFLDRLINLSIPRVKDFRGLPDTSFDGRGNYSMGVTEQAIFPEVDMASVSFTHGMNINMVFYNSDKEKSKFVLGELGFPFKRPEEEGK
ncbi:MAG: 50S ribosomal protein L5 [Planctomycetota bacterium]